MLSSPQSDNKLLDNDFDAWLHDLGIEWGMKGLSIAAVRLDSSGQWNVETKGYGIKDSAKNPVTEDVGANTEHAPHSYTQAWSFQTIFSIGSNSKLFAALSLAFLVEDPNVNLEWTTKNSRYLA